MIELECMILSYLRQISRSLKCQNAFVTRIAVFLTDAAEFECFDFDSR